MTPELRKRIEIEPGDEEMYRLMTGPKPEAPAIKRKAKSLERRTFFAKIPINFV